MKDTYENAVIEIIHIQSEDIVTSSSDPFEIESDE